MTPIRQGKVRDLYDADEHLLIVATDRISAFDYVLGSGIPDKGKVLNQLSAFWFDLTREIVEHHVQSVDVADYPARFQAHADVLRGRSMLVRRTEVGPDRVRGPRVSGRFRVEGVPEDGQRVRHRSCRPACARPTSCRSRSSRRPRRPRRATTRTSARTRRDASSARDLIARLKDYAIRVYARGAAHAESRGIIVADTKFEFGIAREGGAGDRVLLIDEVLTPDSSRFWPMDGYKPGGSQPSFDKQYVRDYLEQIRWNKQPPVPSLPDEVVARTREKYVEALRRLTGHDLD